MKKYKEILLSISKLYKVNLLFMGEMESDGAYVYSANTIELSNKLFNSNSFFKEEYIIYIFCHELAHHIQNQLYWNCILSLVIRKIPFLYWLYEKQADSMAYSLYSKDFLHLFKISIDKNFFSVYNTFKDFKRIYNMN